MPLRNVATNYTFEQQRQEINLLAADVDTLTSNVTALQGLQATETTDSPTFNNLTLTGYLAGPATLTIDPAAVGDNTGTVVIAGNLQVDGVTTTVNSTTMTVDDVSITLASGAANAAAADGAGIDVDGASATFYYRSTPDAWASNKKLLVNQTSEQGSRANLEVTSTKDASFPQYSYGIMATDDAAYNVNPGSGYGFGYKWNAAGNYAQGGGIRMIKENTTDNDYAGAMLFYTRPMGDGPLERLRIKSDGTSTFKYKVEIGDSYVGGEVLKIGKTSGTSYIAHYDGGTAHGFIGHASELVSGGASDDFAIRATNDLCFATNGNNERLRISSGGQLTLDLPTNTTSRHIGIVNSTGTIGWTLGNGVTAAARQFVIYDNEAGAVRLKIDASGNVSDSIGNIRSLGLISATSSFTIASDHAGKFIRQTTAGRTMTVPANVFSIGTMITIVNRSSGTQTIAQGSGVTMYNSADGSTGNRTLAANGMCTLLFTASNEVYISGAGLS